MKVYYKGTRLRRRDTACVIVSKHSQPVCVGPETMKVFMEELEDDRYWSISVKHSIYRMVTDGDGNDYARFKNRTESVSWIS